MNEPLHRIFWAEFTAMPIPMPTPMHALRCFEDWLDRKGYLVVPREDSACAALKNDGAKAPE